MGEGANVWHVLFCVLFFMHDEEGYAGIFFTIRRRPDNRQLHSGMAEVIAELLPNLLVQDSWP